MDTDHPALRIAVIGLGAMGSPMARRLAGAFDVTAFDVDSQRLSEVADAGVAPATSPAEAAQGADTILLAVRDAAQVRSALFGADGVVETAASPAVVVLTSTVGVDVARDVERQLDQRGLGLVDAPVSGGPRRAGAGDLLVTAAARPQVLERANPILAHLASNVTVVGDRAGDGQVVKTINQLLAGVHIAAAAEALALARELGLDPGALVPVLSSGAAHSFMLADRGPRMAGGYTGEQPVMSRLDIFVKDLGLVGELAREARVPTPLATAAEQLFRLADRAGLGATDDSSLITLLSPRSSPEEPS